MYSYWIRHVTYTQDIDVHFSWQCSCIQKSRITYRVSVCCHNRCSYTWNNCSCLCLVSLWQVTVIFKQCIMLVWCKCCSFLLSSLCGIRILPKGIIMQWLNGCTGIFARIFSDDGFILIAESILISLISTLPFTTSAYSSFSRSICLPWRSSFTLVLRLVSDYNSALICLFMCMYASMYYTFSYGNFFMSGALPLSTEELTCSS